VLFYLIKILIFLIAVYRQGEIGSSWYAVLGGSLEARLTHTTQTSSTNTDKVSPKQKSLLKLFKKNIILY